MLKDVDIDRICKVWGPLWLNSNGMGIAQRHAERCRHGLHSPFGIHGDLTSDGAQSHAERCRHGQYLQGWESTDI